MHKILAQISSTDKKKSLSLQRKIAKTERHKRQWKDSEI
jgi:hypothetical protein